MEHIVKQTDFELIKRYELSKGNIWVSRILLNGKTFFGVGESQKEAEYNLVQKKEYAINAMPPFLYRLGSYSPANKFAQVYKAQKASDFASKMMVLPVQTNCYILCSDSALCLVIEDESKEFVPQYFWTTDMSYNGIRNCVYQVYIKLQDDDFFSGRQNKKLGEWFNVWYNKLQSRSLK